jgi:hypothetical protein
LQKLAQVTEAVMSEASDAIQASFSTSSLTPARVRPTLRAKPLLKLKQHAPVFKKRGYRPQTPEHLESKEKANCMFIRFSEDQGFDPRHHLAFFLDGDDLRTSKTCQGHGWKHLHMANPSQDICVKAHLLGVDVLPYQWTEAAKAYFVRQVRFKAIYLDLCNGSSAHVLEQLEAAVLLATPKCLLAVTVTARGLDGETMAGRSAKLMDFFMSKGWAPAAKGSSKFSDSMFEYPSSTGAKNFTQFWASP